jgi:hypothetical protein
MWALGYGVRFAPTREWRNVCAAMLDRALGTIEWLEHARSEAFALIGVGHAYAATSERRYESALRWLGERLAERFERTAVVSWRWFEEMMTYDNARLCQAVLRAGELLEDERFINIGGAALDFLESVVFEDGIFVPIGSSGWYPRGGKRARFAQQPLEATGMIEAELAAFDVLGQRERLRAAETALAWYYGKNSIGQSLVRRGGCCDGIDAHGCNQNMGAESTLAYLAGAYALAERHSSALRIAR